jgi:hypothetical protein
MLTLLNINNKLRSIGMTNLIQLRNEVNYLVDRCYKLKSKQAKNKARDKAHSKRIEYSIALQDALKSVEYLPQGNFTVSGIIGGLGAVKSNGTNVKILEVYLEELVVAIATKEYPKGEVFKVPHLGTKLADLNFTQLIKA